MTLPSASNSSPTSPDGIGVVRGWRLTAAVLLLCASPMALASSASAQMMLYENHLPDGFAYVRFVNTLPDPLAIKPVGFADPVNLGTEGASRVSSYFTVEKVAGRDLAMDLGAGATNSHATFVLKPGAFHTVLIGREGGTATAKVVTDQAEINQTRARLAFYNALSDCPAAGLQLEPSASSIFKAVEPGSMRGRSVNPAANAHVKASCGATRTAAVDLGSLSAGGQYSVWYMAPAGTPVAFVSENTIAPYMR